MYTKQYIILQRLKACTLYPFFVHRSLSAQICSRIVNRVLRTHKRRRVLLHTTKTISDFDAHTVYVSYISDAAAYRYQRDPREQRIEKK